MTSDFRYKLLCQLASSNSLQEMMDLAYELLGNPVFTADMAHTMLAYTKVVDIPNPLWQNTVVRGKLERNLLRQNLETSMVHDASVRNRMPMLVTDDEIPYPRIIKALVLDGRSVGVVVLTAYLQPLGPDDIELMELISTFVLNQMIRENFITSANTSTVENYLIKLLETERSLDEISKRFELLSYFPRKYVYVLTAKTWDDTGKVPNSTVPTVRDDFATLPHCKAFFYDTELVLVCDFDSEVCDWAADAPELAQRLSAWNMRAGVSRSLTRWDHFADYHQQACQALNLGHALSRDQLFFSYDLFSAYLMLEQLPSSSLLQYCHQKILTLHQYDLQQNSSLCMTLQVYLEHTKSLAKTAELLYIHRNTVHYRINKCMELMNSRLEDGNEIFSFILSLRILEYLKKNINHMLNPPPTAAPDNHS